MIPRLFFLGTAGDSYVLSKGLASASGIVINDEHIQILIDPGSGTTSNLNKNGINIHKTSGIILSSSDTIFSSDLNQIIHAMSFDGIDPNGVLIATKKSILGEDDETPILLNKTQKYLDKFIIMNDEQKVSIRDILINVKYGYMRNINNQNNQNNIISNEDNLICRISLKNNHIGYISNTCYDSKISDFLKGVSILILSLIDLDDYSRNDSINLNDAIKLVSEINPSLAIITNFGQKVIKNDPQTIAKEINNKLGIHTIVAKEGLEINPLDFMKKFKQKNLENY